MDDMIEWSLKLLSRYEVGAVGGVGGFGLVAFSVSVTAFMQAVSRGLVSSTRPCDT